MMATGHPKPSTIATLNIRGGLNNDLKRRGLARWIRESSVDIALLTECHGAESELSVYRKYFPNSAWCFGPRGSLAGVGIVLSAEFTIVRTHCFQSADVPEEWDGRAVAVDATLDDTTLIVVCVYGPAQRHQRAGFYDAIAQWLTSVRSADDAFILAGDFNCTINPVIDRLPPHSVQEIGASELCDLIERHALRDFWRLQHGDGATGMTLCSRDGGSRIDRFYGNDAACSLLKAITIVPFPHSDHSAATAQMQLRRRATGEGRWIFNNSLLSDDAVISALRSAWQHSSSVADKSHLSATQRYLLCEAFLSSAAKAIARQRARMRSRDNCRVYRHFVQAFESMQADQHSVATIGTFTAARAAAEQVEDYRSRGAAVRSRCRWLREGEAPTKYFFRLAAAKSVESTIPEIKGHDGEPVTSNADILDRLATFYEQLYTPADVCEQSIDHLLSMTQPKITSSMRASCEAPVTLEEATAAATSMRNNKSPGPSGLTGELYKALWDVIGPTFIAMANECINSATIPRVITEGITVLLFKKGDRTDPSNYRPISLLNTSYKLLTRILTSRLARTVPHLVHGDQYGFVPGRNIHEAVMTVQTVIDCAAATKADAVVAMLDQRKAFGRVHHGYLLRVLRHFGFGERFVSTLAALYVGGTSRVFANRFFSRAFNVGRGVRQGDPLSPFLYALAIEPLACTVRANNNIRGFWASLCPEQIKLTMFADDITATLRDWASVDELFRELEVFGRASNACINRDKTEYMVLGQLADDEERRINDGLPSNREGTIHHDPHDCVRLLGSQIGPRLNQQLYWHEVRASVARALHGWHTVYLSVQGRCYVAQAIGMGMLRHKLNTVPCNAAEVTKLQSLLSQFIWQGRHDWIDRRTMSLPRSQGGRGAPLVRAHVDAIHLEWIRTVTEEPLRPWKALLNDVLSIHEPFCKRVRLGILRMSPIPISPKLPSFWSQVLRTWARLRGGLRSDYSPTTAVGVLHEPLFNNSLVQDQDGRPLKWRFLQDKGLCLVHDFYDLQRRKFWSPSEGAQAGALPPRTSVSRYQAALRCIPLEWRAILRRDALLDNGSPVNAARTGVEQLGTMESHHLSAWAGTAEVHLDQATIKTTSETFKRQIAPDKCSKRSAAHWETALGTTAVDWAQVWRNSSTRLVDRKVSDLSWRAAHNSLPLRSLPWRAASAADTMCPVCEQQPETTLHLLWQCPAAQACWTAVTRLAASLPGWNAAITAVEAVLGPTGAVPKHHQAFSIGLLSTARWIIWKHRCHVVHQTPGEQPPRLLTTFLAEFHRVAADNTSLKRDVDFWAQVKTSCNAAAVELLSVVRYH
jgi:exonuclease III